MLASFCCSRSSLTYFNVWNGRYNAGIRLSLALSYLLNGWLGVDADPEER